MSQAILSLLKIFLFCAMICSSHAQGTAELYIKDCSSCFDVFSAEFDESKMACGVSADKCKCQLKVLDLSACVIDEISENEKRFDLVVNGSSRDTAASKYTAAWTVQVGWNNQPRLPSHC